MPSTNQSSTAGRDAEDSRPEGAEPEKLRVGTLHLGAAEAFTVRAFVQMGTTFTKNFRWVFVEGPPFNAVVVDYESRQLLKMKALATVDSVLFITDHEPESPNMLQRPLRFRELEQWLNSKAAEIRAVSQAEPEPPEAAEAVELPDDGDCYIQKLGSWPPTAFICRDPLRLRLATMLATNGMNLSDLLLVSRESGARTRACVRDFLKAGLLKLEEARQRPATDASDARPSIEVTRASGRSKPGRGLIASIRRRLGI